MDLKRHILLLACALTLLGIWAGQAGAVTTTINCTLPVVQWTDRTGTQNYPASGIAVEFWDDDAIDEYLGYAVTNSDGTLTFTPATNALGKAEVTVSVTDSGGIANGYSFGQDFFQTLIGCK